MAALATKQPLTLPELIHLAEVRRVQGSTACPDPSCARLTGAKHKQRCSWALVLLEGVVH